MSMNKKHLAKKLDRLASNVAKKGIFVVSKQNKFFVVQDHISKKVVYNEIPLRHVAEYLCKQTNKGKLVNGDMTKSLRDLIWQYHKFTSDIMFYTHTLRTTNDPVKYDMTEARLSDARGRLDYTRYELQRYS